MDDYSGFSPQYLTEREVARMTGLALQTLRNWRFERREIPWVRVGKRGVRYSLADVVRYMENRRIEVENI